MKVAKSFAPKFSACAVLCLLLALAAAETGFAAREPQVTVDGERLAIAGQGPVFADGFIFVPVRAVFERLGFTVSWSGETQTARLISDERTIEIVLGHSYFALNGSVHLLDMPARLVGGVPVVPVAAILEQLGMEAVISERPGGIVDGISIRTSVAAATAAETSPELPPAPFGLPDASLPPADFAQAPPPPGWETAAPPEEAAEEPRILFEVHVVAEGETLSQIAAQRYPDLDHDDAAVHERAVAQIERDNPVIESRDRIQPGWELRIYPFGHVPEEPAQDGGEAEAAAAIEFPHLPKVITVEPGDNLDLIVRRYYSALDLDDIGVLLSVIAHVMRDNPIIPDRSMVQAGWEITLNPYVRR